MAIPFVLDEAITLLSRTPPTLDALLRGLPGTWLTANEGGDTWSPFDIVGHLVHGERTDGIPRIRIVLEHGDGKAFDAFDRRAHFGFASGMTMAGLLDEFPRLRRDSLA